MLCVLFILGVMTGGNLDAAAGEGAAAIMPTQTIPMLHLKGVRVSNFSSTTGKAICKLRVGRIIPARKRTGPFILPAPGYELHQIVIDIIPETCTEDDWDTLAGRLAELRRFTLREAITLRLLDASGGDAGAEWRVDGAPSLLASPAEPGGSVLHFSSRDTASRRVPLFLFRDKSSGAPALQSPPPRPDYSNAAQ